MRIANQVNQSITLAILVCLSLTGCWRSTSPAVPASLPPTPERVVSPIPPAANPTPPGWTNYASVNDVHNLLFTPDGALWAATSNGVVRWDLHAQSFLHYTQADGLPSPFVTDIALASDGSLWLATLGGVSHFDGRRWRSFTQADGLVSNAVQSLAVTTEGMVWAGTTEGVGRFDGSTWTSYLAGVRAWDVEVAPDGALWFANQGGGIGRYLSAQDSWITYPAEQGPVTAISVAPDGEVWGYINYQGVFRFDGTTWQREYEISQRVCDIAFAAEGTPWIGTCGTTHSETGALFYRQGDTWVDLLATHGLVNAPVRAVAAGPKGIIAAGTDRGIGIYQEGTWHWLRGGPMRSQVTNLAVMPDGTVWLGFGDSSSYYGPGNGLSRFDGQSWEYSLEGSGAQVLAVAPDGALWAAAGCAVSRFDGTAWQSVAVCEPLKSYITDIAFTPDGSAWVTGGGMGLARFAGASWTSYDKLAIFLAVAPDGKVWITGWEGLESSSYVAHFDGQEWTTYYTDQLFQDSLSRIAVTPDGSLWGATGQHGLARFDGQAWTFHSLPDGLASDISALRVAPDGALWIGTSTGAARLADPSSGATSSEAWTVYTSADGLVGDNVRAIAFAPDGAVWFGTSDGASRYQPWPGK